MAVALRIARLHTQLRHSADSDQEGLDQRWLRELAQRQLPGALEGVAERALARAGLPAEAVVAIRQLRLRLQLGDGASEAALLKAWSQALEQALVLALEGTRQGGGHDDAAQAVVFSDAWAAELSHLSGLLRTGRCSWWADRLLDGRGERLDLTPAAILRRWLERQPARAVKFMAQLAELPSPQNLHTLLPEAEAQALAQSLARLLSQRPDGELALPEAGTPLRALLENGLDGLRRHPQLGSLPGSPSGATTGSLQLWRLALLLKAQPSLALLSPATLLAAVAAPSTGPLPAHPQGLAAEADPTGSAAPRPSPTETLPSDPSLTSEPTADPPLQSAWIHAGGLLLLLNRPEPDISTTLGDLTLLALLRLLAPLGPGERAAALQRERPLLTLLAPDRDWPERLDQAQLLDPQGAARGLEAWIASSPEGIGYAPGALRQVYGPLHGATPPLPDQASQRLAALVWRPGLLAWDGWEIRCDWPLASVDLALRKAGWDLDPGWQPALRRVVRFHYRPAAEFPAEERP